MKKFLSLALALAMTITLVPATAFASTTNRVSKTVVGKTDDELKGSAAPVLQLKASSNFTEPKQQFQLQLKNAEWLSASDIRGGSTLFDDEGHVIEAADVTAARNDLTSAKDTAATKKSAADAAINTNNSATTGVTGKAASYLAGDEITINSNTYTLTKTTDNAIITVVVNAIAGEQAWDTTNNSNFTAAKTALEEAAQAVKDVKVAESALDVALTTADVIGIKRVTDSLITVDVNAGVLLKTDSELRIPLYVKLTGEKASVEVVNTGAGSEFSSGEVVFATANDGDTRFYTESQANFKDGGKLKNIFIDEITAGTFEQKTSSDPTELKIKINSGFNMTTDSNTKVKLASGKFNGTYTEGDITISVNSDGDIATISIPKSLLPTQSAVSLLIEGLKVKEDGASFGKVAKLTLESNGGASRETIDVGTYSDFTVQLKAEEKELPTIYAGDRDDDNKALKVTLKELVDGAWTTGRKTELKLSEGLKFANVEVKKAENVTPTKSTLESDMKKWIDGDTLTIPADGIKANNGKIQIDAIFTLIAEPGTSGDAVLTVTGPGVANEKMTATIATVKAPVAVKASVNEVKIDYRETPVSDITITEPKAGLWEKGQYITLRLDEMQFEKGAKAEVISGDDFKLESLDGNNVKINKSSDKDTKGTLSIQVKATSTSEPAQIKISGLKLFLERNLPTGDYALDLVYPGGEVKTDATRDLIEFAKGTTSKYVGFETFDNTDTDKVDGNLIPGFDTKEYTVLKDYVKVITGGRDQNNTVKDTTIVIGESKITVGGTAVPIDAPAYINKDNYTMLPMRALVENVLGGTVTWNDTTRTASFVVQGKAISLTLGSKDMLINGTPFALLTQPEIKNERVFLPVRDVVNALSLNINWDEAKQTVSITAAPVATTTTTTTPATETPATTTTPATETTTTPAA